MWQYFCARFRRLITNLSVKHSLKKLILIPCLLYWIKPWRSLNFSSSGMRFLGALSTPQTGHGILTHAAWQMWHKGRRLTGAFEGRQRRRRRSYCWFGGYTEPTGIVETVLWGVVGREPARDATVDALRDCMVPI